MTKYSLRGGGCSPSGINKMKSKIFIEENQDLYDFFSKFNHFVNIIDSKASLVANQQEQQQIMIAIQWFKFQEENIYNLNKNSQSVNKSYDLILDGIRRLLKSCLIYIKADSFKCLNILQITASLSKVIFSFHIMNKKRYMTFDLQNQFLEISDELKKQMEIEKNDLIQNQMELFLLLTKASFEMAPNNHNEQQEILKGCLRNIIKSILEMKPNIDLLQSLFQGACLLQKIYNINNKRKQYEVYYQIDMLQWEIITYFKNEKQNNLEEIIQQLETIYDKLVKTSYNWNDHYCWIQMLEKILVYNPLLSIEKLDLQIKNLNLNPSPVSLIWKEYEKKGILYQINHSNNQALILINQLKDKQLIYTERLILESFYQGWQNYILLKEFLMDNQYSKKPFTFGSYLNCKLDLDKENIHKNEDYVAMDKLQKLLSLIISHKLLSLIQQNQEKLEIVIKIFRNLIKRNNINLRITEIPFKQQLQKIIFNLGEYLQNTLHIIKILSLTQNQQKHFGLVQFQSQKSSIKLNSVEQLKYLMKLLENNLQIFTQEFQEKSIDQKDEQQQVYNKIDDIKLIEEQKTYIYNQLTKIQDLKDKTYQIVKPLNMQLIALTNSPQKNTALSIIKFIENSQKEIKKLQNDEIKEKDLFKQFQNLLNYLLFYYERKSEKLNFQKSNTVFEVIQVIMTLNNQINDTAQTNEISQNIQELISTSLIIENFEMMRFEMLKFNQKLIVFQEFFQNIIKLAEPEIIQKISANINLDEFLLEVIKKYPEKILLSRCDIQNNNISKIKSITISNDDFKNNLSNQKQIIEFLLFKLNIEELINDSERQDLQLIEKHFEELFIQQSSLPLHVEKLDQIIEGLQIDDTINNITNENFNQKQLKLEEDKFENFLNQLTLIRESSKDQNQQIIEIEILIKKAEVVVETFLNCENQNIEIFKIPLCEEIRDLKKIIENCKKNKDRQDNDKQNIYQESHLNKLNILNNTSDLDQFGKKDQIDDIYYQKLKKFDNCFDEKYITNLKFIIKIVKLYQIKIKEEKQVLHELLEEIQKFTSKIDFMKKYEGTIQEKMQQSFIACFEKMINNLEQKYWPTNSLSLQKNENQQMYFEKIFANFYSIINENEKIKNLTDDLKYPALCSQIDQGAIQKLEAKFQGKAREKSFRLQKIQIKQEILIQSVSKIYLKQNLEQEFEKDPNQQIGLFNTLIQKYKDFKNNEEWKIKQGLVFSIISISSNCFTDTIIQFCQKALIQIWIQEKDERIRNLLKNQNLITSQIQILKKDWKTQCDRISGEMQQLLHKIDDLQEQISHEYNLKKRDQQLQEVDETTQQLNEYIENISEMGQQLDLIHNFVSNIRQGLKRIEGKINQIKMQLNNMDNDIKFLRGKSVEQLLEIRKWKVLDEAAYKKIKSIYVPLKTQEKMKENIKNLMSLEEFDNKVGAVDEFLQEEKTVLLIHGMAGSGKTTAAKKIEEFIWKLHENNRKINKQQLIPIYISLPSLKNPVFQAVEEALQNDYGFDQLQLKECKEMLEKKQFRFLLIMDSYDEMKLENIQKNLYINNKINQNWTNPLVIFTTRSEILTSSNYAQWFAPDDQEKLKEIQILKFDQVQKQEYLKKYTIQSIKMLIFEIYEWQIQVQSREAIDINKFEMCWEKLQSSIFKYDLSKLKSETLLNQKQIESILLYLNDDEFIALKSNEAIRSLRINLQKLWSVEKYDNMMQQMNLNKFMETPYMMEIIVQVLPEMMVKAAEIVNLKQNFIKNFSKMFKDFFKSKSLIHLYNQYKKNYLIKVNNEVEKETCQKNFVDQNKKWEVLQVYDCFDSTSTDLQNWEKIDNLQIALEVWNRMEENLIPSQLQISNEFNELSQKLLQIFQLNRGLPNNELNKVEIKKENLIQLVFDALKEQNLTNYDFYDEFINMYHLKQIEKQRSLRKSINIDRFLHDLKQYSIKLAKTMSKKLVTQVQYQQQGLLYKDEREEEKWLNEFFNDDGQYGSYKKDIRSCSLIQQKGTNFQFVHKSIQEFLIAVDLYEVLVLSKDFDIQIFRSIIEILSKQRYEEQNCEEFLSSQEHFEIYINEDNLSLFERQQKFNTWQKSIMSIINLIKILKQHDFNQINYSTEIYTETRKFLIKKISSEVKIIEFLKLIVHLTSLDKNLIQSGSNSLNILVEMKVDLTNQFFLNIRIQNTSLIGGNFAKCNLSGAEFQNININGMNLNGAQLFDCKWKNLRINDLHQLNGHDGPVNSLCFSPDGIILASGSMDQSIRLWDVGTGQQQSIFQGHSNSVQSVCFSPDGSVLASGSDDKTIRLWNFKTGKQILQLNGHHAEVLSVCFSVDGRTLASGGGDKTIRLWDIKTGHQKSNLEGHSNNVTSVCFSPDGTNLASASWDNTIRLWDVKSGQQMSKFDGHISYISSICFSPDGTTLASGSNDKSIRLWDVKTGQQKSKLQGHSYGVYSICFSLDGNTLASGSDDNSIRLWDVKTGQQKSKLDGHSNAILSVSFSPDGIKLASACWDNSIRLWDVKTEQQKTQLEGHSSFVSSVCFSPDGTTLASGSNDSSIRLWDVKTGQQKSKLEGHSNAVLSVCFSPDGTTLASGSNDKSIRLWDIKTGQQMFKLDGHNFAVYSICFSPDCTMLSSGSDDSSIRLWDVKTGLQILKLDGHSNAVLSVCFSPDGTILAFGSDDNSISLWDVKTEQLQLKLEGHNGWVQSVCFSPDGRILGSCSGDKSIRLWDVKTGKQKSLLNGHTHHVQSICFSPDGTTLASGSNDCSILLWDVETGQQKSKLDGHTHYVQSVCFSPDGTLLASGSCDQSIRLWEVKKGQIINPLEENYKDNLAKLLKPLQHISFSEDVNNNITIQHISQQPIFQAKGALILNGEFTNHLGMDLRKLFEQRGSFILETYLEQQKNKIKN